MVQKETTRPHGRIYSSLCVPLTFYVQSKMRWGGAVPLKQRKSCTPVCVLSIPRMTQPPEKKPYLLKKEKKMKQPLFGAIGRKRRHRTRRRVAARVTKNVGCVRRWARQDGSTHHRRSHLCTAGLKRPFPTVRSRRRGGGKWTRVLRKRRGIAPRPPRRALLLAIAQFLFH